MKNIKFRAKQIGIDKVVYGYYLFVKDYNSHYIFTGDIKSYPVDEVHPHLSVRGFEWILVYGDSVQQLVGINEETGEEIYE